LQLSQIPALADAADVLSDQLRRELAHIAKLTASKAPGLERKFRSRLKSSGYDAAQIDSLVSLTFGAAAHELTNGGQLAGFFARVAKAGRYLAKYNLPPGDVLDRLQEYDALLDEVLARKDGQAIANSRWAREQLHFCVVLSLNNAYYQVREAETQAFQRVSGLELESKDLNQLHASFIETMAGICHAFAARLYLTDTLGGALEPVSSTPTGGSTPASIRLTSALRRRLSQPLRLNGRSPFPLDRSWHGKFRSVWSVPMLEGGELAGLMLFAFKEPDARLLPRELDVLRVAAERCLRAADRSRLLRDLADRETQLKALAEHMLQVEEMERRRISRELHDDAGQSLVCIRLQLELTEGEIPEELADVRRNLQEIRDLTEKTILDIRRLISDLSPAVLEQLGLGAAVRQLVNRFRKAYPCSVRLHVGKLTEVPQKVQIVTYRLLQECCNNIARHSNAANVNISVTSADRVLKLNVSDDGVGFAVENALAKHKSFGLAGMRERVALLGGRFLIRSQPLAAKTRKRGTEIQIELPIPAEESALPRTETVVP
jgi:signal transduction histidine kinase